MGYAFDMSKLDKAEKREKIDLEKLGQDFADLTKAGKFAEVELLAQQVKIPMRQISSALDTAIYQLERTYGTRRHDSKTEAVLSGMSDAALKGTGTGVVAGMAIESVTPGAGIVGGGLVGFTYGLIAGMRRGQIFENIQKLKEAKKYIEKH